MGNEYTKLLAVNYYCLDIYLTFCLIFYGHALIQKSKTTYNNVRNGMVVMTVKSRDNCNLGHAIENELHNQWNEATIEGFIYK